MTTTGPADPGNPRRVANPFGEKSEIRFPDYREPNWLLTEPAGPLRSVQTPAGRLDAAACRCSCGRRRGCPPTRAAPLLLVHDGSDMADRGSLLSWATSISRDLPIRVALLDPPHGLRDQWYAADPDYSDHLAEVVLPALTSRVLTGPVIGLGRQPRARSACWPCSAGIPGRSPRWRCSRVRSSPGNSTPRRAATPISTRSARRSG